MKHSKYEKYKNSGIAWLGNIPEHWEVKRVKQQFEVTRGRVIPNTDLIENGLYPVYSSQTKNNGLLGKINSYDFEGEYISWTTDGVYAGTTFVRKGKFNATNICGLLKSRTDENINFLGYLFSHITPPNKRPDTNGAKIMSNEMKNIFFILPPKQEQITIANFLDYKTEKINRFITKKKQLIELLTEQKAAIINKAVTKGINPNTKLKPSGIEWLGDIPEHWEVRKLKNSVRLNKHTSFDNVESNKTKIALENVESKTGRILPLNENPFEGVGTIFKEGDVLFGKLRPYLAKVVTPKFEGSCVNELLVLSPNQDDWVSEFLKYRMLAGDFISIVDNSTYGAKMPRASWNFIGALKISRPNKTEQNAIIAFIEKEIELGNKTISTIEKEITLVEEYKTALIAEAVTGKIDLRDFVVPSTEEPLEMVAEETSNFNKAD